MCKSRWRRRTGWWRAGDRTRRRPRRWPIPTRCSRSRSSVRGCQGSRSRAERTSRSSRQSRAIEDVARAIQGHTVVDAVAGQIRQKRRITHADSGCRRGREEGVCTEIQEHAGGAGVGAHGHQVGQAVAVDIRDQGLDRLRAGGDGQGRLEGAVAVTRSTLDVLS